jgi:hypothetical protein
MIVEHGRKILVTVADATGPLSVRMSLKTVSKTKASKIGRSKSRD